MEFCVLGPLRVVADGQPLPVTSARQRAVLAVLVLRPNRLVPVAELVDAVWGESPPVSAGRLVQNYVWRLRQLLGTAEPSRETPRIVSHPGGYRLRLEPAELDVLVFDQLTRAGGEALKAGDAALASCRLSEALALWSGEPLTGTPLAGAAAAEAGRLTELRRRTLDDRIEADLRLGRHAELIAELQALTGANPLHERLHGYLMLALCRSGRRAEALQAYQAARQVMVDELGIEPGSWLREIHQGILRGDCDAPPPAPWSGALPTAFGAHLNGSATRRPAPQQLLPDIADFTGRENELDWAIDVVKGYGGAAHLTVSGLPGVGKTCLAIHFAHLMKDNFPDGQLFIDLRGYEQRPVPPGEALGTILRSLGVRASEVPSRAEERRSLYRTVMAGRRFLVFLDNARDESQVRPLLCLDGGCLTIVTSRNVLAGLEAGKTLLLDVLPVDRSLELLGRIAGADRVAAEAAAAVEVTQLCGHLPLAVRIAGARLASRPSWTVADLARRLGSEHARLGELTAGDLGVRAAFELSYHLLPASHRCLFRRLGLVTAPDLTPEPAAALAGVAPSEAERMLEQLVDANLVNTVGARRYRLHDLLRLYAAGLARLEDGDAICQAAIVRALTWYLQTASAAYHVQTAQHHPLEVGAPDPKFPPLTFTAPQAALLWADAEHAGLMAAIRQAAGAGLHEIAWKLAVSMWYYFQSRSPADDWITSQRIGLASARECRDREAVAWLLNNLGTAYYAMRRYGQSTHWLSKSLRTYRQLADRPGEGTVLSNLGCVYGDIANYERAVDCLQQATAIRRELRDERGEALTLNNLGDTYRQMGRYSDAVKLLEQSLAIERAIGDSYSEGITLHSLGDTLSHMNGKSAEALSNFERALAIHRELGNQYGEAITLDSIGELLYRDGQEDAAIESWYQAAAVFDEIRHPGVAEVRARLMSVCGRSERSR